jgi:hypothetical protein
MKLATKVATFLEILLAPTIITRYFIVARITELRFHCGVFIFQLAMGRLVMVQVIENAVNTLERLICDVQELLHAIRNIMSYGDGKQRKQQKRCRRFHVDQCQ